MAKVAFLGTGIMGGHMCRNLARAGHEMVAWNRTQAKADALSDAGVKIATSAANAVADVDCVILMLSDGPTCNAILEGGVYDAMDPSSLLVVMSSIDLASARGQAKECERRGIRYVDAPVSGGEKGAKEASLSIMAGGSEEDFEIAREILNAMGRPVRVGPSGSGQLAKLANQVIVALTITAIAESLILVEAGGADLRAVRDALLGGFADSTIMRQHALRMIEKDFKPGGPAKYHVKDLLGALAAAEEIGVEMPQTQWAKESFAQFVESGGADMDHSGIIEFLREKNKQT